MKTQAAILSELKKPLLVAELEIPAVRPGQVLVELHYSGICRSQIGEWLGYRGPDRYLPHLLGHEGSGIVLETGAGVSKVKADDKVALSWIKGLGAEVPSSIYQWGERSVNAGAVTSFATKALISENRLVRLPEGLSLRTAAALGCAVLTGAGMVTNVAKMKSGATVAVIGAGGIGLSAVMMAKARGATQIIVVDRHDSKLHRASKLGASDIIDSRKEDPLVRIKELTNGQGVDYCFEAAGNIPAMQLAFEMLRAPGGICVLSGNPPKEELLSINPYGLMAGKILMGTSGGASNPDIDIPSIVELHLNDKLDLDALLTDEFQLEDINLAFAQHLAGDIGRGVLCLKQN